MPTRPFDGRPNRFQVSLLPDPEINPFYHNRINLGVAMKGRKLMSVFSSKFGSVQNDKYIPG